MTFESNRGGDYYEDMDADVFEEWFSQMLYLIPVNSFIVLDNALYHFRLQEKLPTSTWRKMDVLEWLRSKNITIPDNAVKRELLDLANINKKICVNHVIGKENTMWELDNIIDQIIDPIIVNVDQSSSSESDMK